MGQMCKIEVCVTKWRRRPNSAPRPTKWGLRYTYSGTVDGGYVIAGEPVPNKSRTEALTFSSVRAALKAHDKLCRHDARNCHYCGDPGDSDDVLAEWVTIGDYVKLAHEQCGGAAGWRRLS